MSDRYDSQRDFCLDVVDQAERRIRVAMVVMAEEGDDQAPLHLSEALASLKSAREQIGAAVERSLEAAA
ncbi:hypothetical protein [Marichromatium gracile]|uniref:Uncharacterized protein n=1 Tax=Marichromatium gracile TaxID=1048 RepID=A0A4R4A4K3_MARGR|nr:hypothetical protein [Marichromatium gracile]MBK1709829.1 hypothetical protein [Marichromatium gracile]TCW32659.1 hypothetical protein EDC29_11725 [Marichromatium gracile]